MMQHPNRTDGFSLVELLLVITLIAALSTVSLIAFNSIGGGASVGGALDLGSSLTLGARLEAMKTGNGARIVIDNFYDPENPENYRRRFAIFRAVIDENGDRFWELAGRPSRLPPGVLFLPEYSNGYFGAAGDVLFDFRDADPQTGTSAGTHGGTCLYYEFNSAGHLNVEPSAADARMVFAKAILQPGGDVQLPEAALTGRRGFLLRTNGRPAFFETVDQMPLTQ